MTHVLNYCPGGAGCSSASNDAIDRHSLWLGPAVLSSMPLLSMPRHATMHIMLNVNGLGLRVRVWVWGIGRVRWGKFSFIAIAWASFSACK